MSPGHAVLYVDDGSQAAASSSASSDAVDRRGRRDQPERVRTGWRRASRGAIGFGVDGGGNRWRRGRRRHRQRGGPGSACSSRSAHASPQADPPRDRTAGRCRRLWDDGTACDPRRLRTATSGCARRRGPGRRGPGCCGRTPRRVGSSRSRPSRALDTRATGGRPPGLAVVPGQKKGPLRGGQPSPSTSPASAPSPPPPPASSATSPSPPTHGYLVGPPAPS